MDKKWVGPNPNLNQIGKNPMIIKLQNSNTLHYDFANYAEAFFEASECIVNHLLTVSAMKQNIAELDLWYFATVYLYRQSLELLLKACIFKKIMDQSEQKRIIGLVRHDLFQALNVIDNLFNLKQNSNKTWLDCFLKDISEFDSESDMFRYPFGSNFKVAFESQKNISLVATQSNFTKAYRMIKQIYDDSLIFDDVYCAFEPHLIIEGGEYYQQSVVGYKYSKYSFYPYFSSYKEVALFLQNEIVRYDKYNYFLPMCYLFRNAIELGLKKIIFEDSHLTNTEALRTTRRKKHSIQGLWNSIHKEVEIIKEVSGAPEDDKSVEYAEKYIEIFHELDPKSDLFRYPCDKNLCPYFSNSKTYDIENVAKCFEELCNFIDGVDTVMLEIKEYEADMQSYCY